MNRQKGSQFERDICRRLSEWWSGSIEGKVRDDIFWRASGSGGRATRRAFRGLKTAGSCGDITALDPIGTPLTNVFTIELKRGRSHGEPGDLLDCKANPKCHKWVATLKQTIGSYKTAGSVSWLIICQRDFRHCVVFFPTELLQVHKPLHHAIKRGLLKSPIIRYRIYEEKMGRVDFTGIRIESFLKSVSPKILMTYASH